jgi:tetratricopeptide (TPR) repeat protein
MKLSQYMKRLEILSKAYRKLVCVYCGTKTAALRNQCMCSNCESIARYGSAALLDVDPMLASSLELINGALAEANYESAIAEYEKLYQYRKDPALLYAEALVYIKYSNSENAKISYDRPGFMEDNAAAVERSIGLASTAKTLLAKSIGSSRADMAEGNSSPNNLHALLLAQLKFGDLRGARDSMEAIEKLGNALMYDYAVMLFETRMGNYGQVMERADAIIRSDEVLVNAFFYAGLAMFKLGRQSDAEKLLKAVGEVSDNSSIPALIEEIRTAERI